MRGTSIRLSLILTHLIYFCALWKQQIMSSLVWCGGPDASVALLTQFITWFSFMFLALLSGFLEWIVGFICKIKCFVYFKMHVVLRFYDFTERRRRVWSPGSPDAVCAWSGNGNWNMLNFHCQHFPVYCCHVPRSPILVQLLSMEELRERRLTDPCLPRYFHILWELKLYALQVVFF